MQPPQATSARDAGLVQPSEPLACHSLPLSFAFRGSGPQEHNFKAGETSYFWAWISSHLHIMYLPHITPSQVYTSDKITQLLDSLRSEVQLMMLFLKHLSSIQVWDWAEGAASPTLAFSCTIDNPSPTLKMDRNMFSKVSGAFHEVLSSMQQSDLDDDSSRALVRAPSSANLGRLRQGSSSTFQLELNSTDHSLGYSCIRRFIVSQASAGGEATDLALELSKHLSAPLVPWGAVAADITLPTGACVGSTQPISPGQAFCFLPLPALTGLPVHINGFFELSSNRRDIWYGTDLAGAGAQRARWNSMLLEQAVAPAYAALLEAATSLLGQSKAFDRLWPQSDVSAPWQVIVPPLYQMVADLPVAWSAASPGRWLPPNRCLLPDEYCLEDHDDSPAGSYKSGEGRALRDGLVHIGLPILGLDAMIVQMMCKHMVRRWIALFSYPLHLTPSHSSPLPQVSRPPSVSPIMTRKQLQQMQRAQPPGSFPVCDVPALLKYCLLDVVPSISGGGLDSGSKQLMGLPLLPLVDGSSTKLTMR